jgi:hypothetical protein
LSESALCLFIRQPDGTAFRPHSVQIERYRDQFAQR